MSKKQKTLDDYEKVVCLGCGLDGDLYFDMTFADNGDSDDGVDIDEDRDPVRCVICRQNSRYQDNELLECEDCQEHYGPFYWTGKHQDCIVCEFCLKKELGLLTEADYEENENSNEDDDEEEDSNEYDSDEEEYTSSE